MSVRLSRALATVLLGVATLTGLAPAASAAGPGTWTKITTPGANLTYPYNASKSPANNTFTVSGQASADVSSVDIDCLLTNHQSLAVFHFATSVPVTAGSFTATAAYPNPTGNCRLRAVPTGVDPAVDYLGSYSGPILYTSAFGVAKDGGTPYTDLAIAEKGDGIIELEDAGACGIAYMATIDVPGMDLDGPGTAGCAFALLSANLTSTGTSTTSAVTVDGHNVYLPSVVNAYLRGTRAINVTQSALTTTVARNNGDMLITESALLMKCSISDAYPPTSGSCPSLSSSGVRFTRVLNLFRGAHQVRIRDTYASTDGHQHAVHAQYRFTVATPDTGTPGFTFPGHGSTFHAATPNDVVSGLGSKAGTMFVRSDLYAGSADPFADTLGFTWSRAPSSVRFSAAPPDKFALPYVLTVPAGGKAHVGFADSEAPTTAGARSRAALAVGDMMAAPTISSPKTGAVITGHKTTVKGAVTLGANGMPTSVMVNGHAAHLTKVSATKATFSVSFLESFGKHVITVTAKDVAGNSKSRSITVKNIAP
jgi:hypothetical protein